MNSRFYENYRKFFWCLLTISEVLPSSILMLQTCRKPMMNMGRVHTRNAPMIANIVPEILQWKNELEENSETQNDTKCKIYASSQNCYLRLVFLTAIFCVVTLWFLVLSTEGFLLKYKVKYEVKYEVKVSLDRLCYWLYIWYWQRPGYYRQQYDVKEMSALMKNIKGHFFNLPIIWVRLVLSDLPIVCLIAT